MTGTTSTFTELFQLILGALLLISAAAFGPASLSTTTPGRSSRLQSTTTTANAVVSFTSAPAQVYIEDTDAYGVMYNANYLRAFERLLYRQDQVLPQDWWVQSVTEQRFKGSPPLGGEFVVQGTLMEKPDDQTETWMCEMISTEQEKPTVYNTALLTITASMQPPAASPLSPLSLNSKEKESATLTQCYYACRDELDPTLSHRIPLRNVLNFFERARSDSFGGPDYLRRMEQQDALVWVVTRIDQLQQCNLQTKCSLAKPLTVETTFGVKRGGMVVECHHALLVPPQEDNPDPVVVAQGVVTIMALDAQSRRPTKRIPEWIQQKLNAKASISSTTSTSTSTSKIEKQIVEQQKEIEANMPEK
jgi:acyl-CoA thioesterase FadM